MLAGHFWTGYFERLTFVKSLLDGSILDRSILDLGVYSVKKSPHESNLFRRRAFKGFFFVFGITFFILICFWPAFEMVSHLHG